MKSMIFTESGYSRLYYSLIRFTNMKRGKAIHLIQDWSNANYLSYYGEYPSKVKRSDFDALAQAEIFPPKPYFTEIQLYKSLQALYDSIDQTLLHGDLLESVLFLRCAISDLAYRFWHSYGIEIESEDTVYSLCNDSLDAYSTWEPTTCLWKDCLRYQRLDLNPFQEGYNETIDE